MSGNVRSVQVTDANGNAVPVGSAASPTVVAPLPYPATATVITGQSGNVAASAAVATLAAVAGKTTYITGFQITAAGATLGLDVSVTVVGLVGGTATYSFSAPAGALIAAVPLVVSFPYPIPASAVNTAIVVTLPSLGTGNTNATVNAQGFQL